MIYATASGKTEGFVRKLGTHKGARRVWLEGRRLTEAGFSRGVRYQVGASSEALTLRLTPAGDHVVSHKADRPVVDLLTRALGTVDRADVVFGSGEISVKLHPLDRNMRRRLARLNAQLAAGHRLRLGSLSHGGGVAAEAILRGLNGRASLDFALDIEPRYLAQARKANPAWSRTTRAIASDLRDVDPAALGETDILEAGLPCVAASPAGRAKKHLSSPEDDPAVQGLPEAFLEVIAATQPNVIVLENVPQYADSASADMIRDTLVDMGYSLREMALDGAEWALEARSRWVLVASTRGLDISGDLVPTARPATVAEVLDRRPSGWRSTANLDRQLASAKAKGQGFARGRKLLTAADTSVPTLRRGYQKGGKCDPRLAHPTRPGLARLFSAAEHARIKGIDPRLVRGASQRMAHEILGQSVIAPAFVALGGLIGRAVPTT